MLARSPIVLRTTAIALFLAATSAAGWTERNRQNIVSGGPALAPTRFEVYGGYSYFRPVGGSIATRRYEAINTGAIGGVTAYFNRSLGVQLEGGASPTGPNDSFSTLAAGPVLRYSYARLVPFVHALGGLSRVRGPAFQTPTYGWGLTGRAGIDYVLPYFRRSIALRPIQADYEFTHVNYGTLAADGLTGGLGEVKAYRVSTGVVLRYGGTLSRERPLVYACSVSPPEVFAGDPVTVTGASTGPATRNRRIYTWEVSGGRATLTDDTASIATAGLTPGSYAITGHLSTGKSAEENATCNESFTVKTPLPPTISCSANPVSVPPGGSATITSVASSAQGRPLSFSYSSSAGQITGLTATATLRVTESQMGPVVVDCNVSDDLGQVTRATTAVNVSAPPAPVAMRRSLCGLSFERDRKRPVRVDNEAKACLDEVALALNREAGARLAITGQNSTDENASQAMARASNARAYLTQEKGIDASRIDLKPGKLAKRTAEIELIPVGTPIRYTDTPMPPTQLATKPLLQQGANAPVPAPAPALASALAPSVGGAADSGPRRRADSLVLPPLPEDASQRKSAARSRRRAAIKRRRRKPATAASVPADAKVRATAEKPSSSE